MQVSLDLRHSQIYCPQSFPFQFHFVLKKRYSAESRCRRTIRWKLFSLPFFSSPFWKTSTIFAANQGKMFVHCCVSHRKEESANSPHTMVPRRPQFDFFLVFYPLKLTEETQNPFYHGLSVSASLRCQTGTESVQQTVAFRKLQNNALNALKRMHRQFVLREMLDARRAIIMCSSLSSTYVIFHSESNQTVILVNGTLQRNCILICITYSSYLAGP